MYIKYKAVNIDSFNKGIEIGLFQGINYSYECDSCRISFIGNFVDILQPMSLLEYNELVYTLTQSLSEKCPILELEGYWILDFEDDFDDEDSEDSIWEEMYEKAKKVLY